MPVLHFATPPTRDSVRSQPPVVEQEALTFEKRALSPSNPTTPGLDVVLPLQLDAPAEPSHAPAVKSLLSSALADSLSRGEHHTLTVPTGHGILKKDLASPTKPSRTRSPSPASPTWHGETDTSLTEERVASLGAEPPVLTRRRCLVFQESSDVLERAAERAARLAKADGNKSTHAESSSRSRGSRHSVSSAGEESCSTRSSWAARASSRTSSLGTSPSAGSANLKPSDKEESWDEQAETPSNHLSALPDQERPNVFHESPKPVRTLKFAQSPVELAERDARRVKQRSLSFSVCPHPHREAAEGSRAPRPKLSASPAPNAFPYKQRVRGIRGGAPILSPAPAPSMHKFRPVPSQGSGSASGYSEDEENSSGSEQEEEEEDAQGAASLDVDVGDVPISPLSAPRNLAEVETSPHKLLNARGSRSPGPGRSMSHALAPKDSRTFSHPICFLPETFQDSAPPSPVISGEAEAEGATSRGPPSAWGSDVGSGPNSRRCSLQNTPGGGATPISLPFHRGRDRGAAFNDSEPTAQSLWRGPSWLNHQVQKQRHTPAGSSKVSDSELVPSSLGLTMHGLPARPVNLRFSFGGATPCRRNSHSVAAEPPRPTSQRALSAAGRPALAQCSNASVIGATSPPRETAWNHLRHCLDSPNSGAATPASVQDQPASRYWSETLAALAHAVSDEVAHAVRGQQEFAKHERASSVPLDPVDAEEERCVKASLQAPRPIRINSPEVPRRRHKAARSHGSSPPQHVERQVGPEGEVRLVQTRKRNGSMEFNWGKGRFPQ